MTFALSSLDYGLLAFYLLVLIGIWMVLPPGAAHQRRFLPRGQIHARVPHRPVD